MTLTISLNGPDNVGKTTQMDLLPRDPTVSKIGGLHEVDKKLGDMFRDGSMAEWWWASTPEDFVRTIFGALARRYWTSAPEADNNKISIFDRGVTMFEAVAVAVIAIKNKDDDTAKARAVLDSILDKHGLRLPREDVAILMTHGETDEESVRITMSWEKKPDDERYIHYQRLLHSELRRQELAGMYQHVIHISAGDAKGVIQDKIRKFLFEKTASPIFRPMMHNLEAIYAFGGLSECGKSTIATKFCEQFGTGLAARTKIGYFTGAESYELSEKEQALQLFHELDRFQRSHYWLRVITIESVHRDAQVKWLKDFLGEKFQTVFIDVDESKRRDRSLVDQAERIRNDEVKVGRGTVRVRSCADLVLDNNGSLPDTMAKLTAFAIEKGLAKEFFQQGI